MQLVAEHRALQHVIDHGGDLYVWARGFRCCAGRSYVLEAATRQPDQEFHCVHAERGISVWTPPGLAEPEEIQLEMDRRGRLRAYWNGQAWIG